MPEIPHIGNGERPGARGPDVDSERGAKVG